MFTILGYLAVIYCGLIIVSPLIMFVVNEFKEKK